MEAVKNVSFSVNKGETLAIVGESGSGKSVTCYSLLDLLPKPPAKVESGEALFEGSDLLKCSAKDMRSHRCDDIAIIFQDPMTSLRSWNHCSKTRTRKRYTPSKKRGQKLSHCLKKLELKMPRSGLILILMNFLEGCDKE